MKVEYTPRSILVRDVRVVKVSLLYPGDPRQLLPADKTAIGRQIEATDRQIHQLVYELYGLTSDEIKIVEEATRQ